MRKPRDYDSELKALDEKTKLLKARRLHQLGELVVATGADALPVEQLAGVLLAAVEDNDAGAKEGWRKRGATFFQGSRTARRRAGSDTRGASTNHGDAQSTQRQDRAQ
ncbi:MAG: conjugal transfer protein TraD [Alphaproteobacteria bacterium]|nr:conjugal transfer protein TraD [Alphaproteobacteria bacterium]MBU0794059.1 conjugal transfer protein TraD [Alphaproteobacteria bacterium]MBU1770239.1 conjugal transfer protein TraD [Alphaproteobacteria bacterium]